MATQVGAVEVGINANAKAFMKQTESIGKNAGSKLNKSIGTAINFGKIYLGFKLVQKGLKETVGRAMDVVESENLVAESFGRGTKELQEAFKWSEKLADAVGANEFELRKNAATLFNMAEATGVTRKESINFATELTALTADLSSFLNMDQDRVFENLQSGLAGQSRALRQLKVFINEAMIKQEAYATGLAEEGAELTENQKIMARYQLIMQQTGKAQGDMARTMMQPANQLRILMTRFQLIGTYVGKIFLPIAGSLLRVFNNIALALVNATRNAANFVQQLFNIETAATGAKAATDAQEDLKDSIEATGKAAKKGVAGFDEINQLAEGMAAGTGGAIDTPIVDDGNIKKTEEANKVMTEFELKVREITTRITNAFKRLKDPIAELWEELKSFGQNVDRLFGEEIRRAFELMLYGIVRALELALVIIEIGLKAISETVKFFNMLMETDWQAVWLGIQTFTKEVFDGIFLVINNVIFWIGEVIRKTWEAIKQKTHAIFNGIKTFLSNTWTNIQNSVATSLEFIKTTFSNIWNSIKTTTGKVWSGIWSTIKGFLNLIIGGINKVLDAWNNLKFEMPKKSVNVFGKKMSFGGFSIGTPNIPNIPELANGGIVTNDTIARVGEGRSSEAVIPLNDQTLGKLAGMITQAMGMMQPTQTAGDNTVMVNIDGKEMARVLIPSLSSENQRMGMRTVIQGV